MGDTTKEPDFSGWTGAAPDAFGALDEPLWDPISMATVLRANPQFDELVLDACSGDGASAIPTAELVGVGGVVDAVDVAPALVERARERVSELAGDGMPQLRLHVADVTTWEPTGYDLVQCVLGVYFLGDIDAGTRHLIERARPGGRVVITMWAEGALAPLPEILMSVLSDGDADDEADEADDDAPGDRDDHQRPAPDAARTPGSLAQWLTGLGLEHVRAETVQRHVEFTPDFAWSFVVGTTLHAVLGDLDDEAVAAVRERYLAALDERGVTSIDISTLIAVGRRPE
jgi:SAM-dependent methyltransferase